jgi:glyoxylase-like metal-dependent hydrolase (beta-lactamase superfamily II)
MRFSEEIYTYEWTDYFDNNCNSFYIGGNVKALIDPGLERYVPKLIKELEDDGIAKEDIRYVINTHSHPDHFEGSVLFTGTDVKVGLHEEEIKFLDAGGDKLFGLLGISFPKIDINLVLKNGELSLGGETFQIILIPGHSPGSLGLYWPSRQVLFPGDVIFEQNVGRTDFPGGDGDLLKKSILALSELEIEALFPGHMGIVDGQTNVKRNFEMVIKHIFPYI